MRKITKREKKQAWRSASISVVCDGPVRANPRMHHLQQSLPHWFGCRFGAGAEAAAGATAEAAALWWGQFTALFIAEALALAAAAALASVLSLTLAAGAAAVAELVMGAEMDYRGLMGTGT